MTDTLLETVKQGNIEQTDRRLEAGVDPNVRGEDGETALHKAVRGGHIEIAALLLAHGADYTVPNAKEQMPLSLDFTDLETLHAVRQHYQRLPLSPYKNALPPTPEIARTIAELRQKGLIKIPGFVKPNELTQLQADFAAFIANIPRRLFGFKAFRHYDNEEYFRKRDKIFVTNNPFRYSSQLVRLCCQPFLVETANHYLQKPAFIQRAVGMRYLSGGPMGQTQFKWHHDMDDKRMKIMILLTDIGDRDQYMTYVLGSHRAFHPYQRFLSNGLDFEYCKSSVDTIEIAKTTGRAGDVFLFDSNGMHSGTRSQGAVRDAFFVEFTADKNNIWGGDLPDNALREVLSTETNPFERYMAVTPKWKRTTKKKPRKGTTWALSLEQPRLWV